jgi:hypothetical protein
MATIWVEVETGTDGGRQAPRHRGYCSGNQCCRDHHARMNNWPVEQPANVRR